MGPRSAGAVPGPAAYGRGGHEPTVTDANLLLGYLGAEAPLAGDVRLDLEAARAAVGGLAGKLGLDVDETAAGIVRVADEEMLRALRVATVERGVDPRGYALVAFGGAGPMHAARLAEQLGVSAGALPARGGLALRARPGDGRPAPRRGAQRAAGRGGDRTGEHGAAVIRELAAAARAGMPDARVETHYDLRYRGQSFELEVTAAPDAGAAELRELFEREHEDRYGYRDARGQDRARERARERDRGTCPRRGHPCPARAAGPRAGAPRCSTAARSRPRPCAAPLCRARAAPGPAVWELPEATAVVPPGWAGTVDEHGTLVLERA